MKCKLTIDGNYPCPADALEFLPVCRMHFDLMFEAAALAKALVSTTEVVVEDPEFCDDCGNEGWRTIPCYINAQRWALMYDKMMYVEGTFGGANAHAWNTLDGKIIDDGSLVAEDRYDLYEAKAFYTSEQVFAHVAAQHGEWRWINDPRGLGKKPE